MARTRGKKALYEVISKTRPKTRDSKTLERLHQESSIINEPTATKVNSDIKTPARTSQWRIRPKIVQFNAGRIDISMPYQLAIAILLGLILLIVVVFRLGQFSRRAANSSAQSQKGGQAGPAARAGADMQQMPELVEKILPSSEKIDSGVSKGDRVIVLVQYLRRSDLEPVKQHFAQYGIETEIIQQGGWYYLVTKNMYENTETPGSDGYKAKQKIIEAGAKYKAPKGYETFAPNFFKDAYGRKIR